MEFIFLSGLNPATLEKVELFFDFLELFILTLQFHVPLSFEKEK